ncbi:MAG: citrate/2-methylcitrate synthase [Kofleriaceae bacterium]|nr:citrate/2-methylcitrate synthase [Kofleriaceae bacterium]
MVDARTAAKHLGIQLRSLYAYVSRGQVRSVPGEHGRPRLYSLDDLERLRVRRDARAGHGAVAAGALRWGEPVLDSAVTAITPRGPAYRGRLAVDLARAGTPFENVAELLWSGYLPEGRVTWPRIAVPFAQLARLLPADATPMDVMPLVVQVASLADRTRDDRRPDAIITRGRQLIPLLAAALAPGFSAASVSRALGAPSVAAVAARALGLDDDVVPLLERVLVVLADHELNASSFTARVTASTGADPYACVAAALATLSGPKHGTASLDVARFADDVGSPEAARNAVRALARKQQVPPGFGHTLYPHGDPRTRPVLDAVAALPSTKRSRTLLAIVAATKGTAPTVDVALAALVAALGLSPEVGGGLFAVARSAGWLAHALEQRAAGYLLRPRARYTGVPVADSP